MQLRFTAAIAVFSTACGARSGLGVSETDEIRDAADGTAGTQNHRRSDHGSR